MIVLLSASGMFLSNELLSGIFCQMNCHYVIGIKIHRALYFNVLLITSCGVQAGGHLLKRALGI